MHLTTIFPEVRLKRYMEMRGGDGGPVSMITALPAFWVGLLYDRCGPAQICTCRGISTGHWQDRHHGLAGQEY